MSGKKTRGAVSASSIVDLKAELFRKQEEFKREKFENQNYVKPKSSKKSNLFSKQNIGVQNRAEKDRKQDSEEKDSLAKSKSALETKAALYDKMARGQLWPEDDEKYMVDFTQKVIDRQEEEKRKQQRKDEEDVISGDIPASCDPGDEWVDYTDSLGRSRRCMKKDLKYLQDLDKDLNPALKSSNTEDEPDLLSADMKREMLRKKWEEEEAEAMSKPVGPVHYENVRYEEVRHTGVGYFAFSKEDEARKKQMEQLEMLRDETSDQRVKREKLKMKRKAAMQARLEKVKQRKKIKGDLFNDEDDVEQKKEEIPVELLTRDESLRQLGAERPWDKGKEKMPAPVRSKPSLPVYNPRDERPSEFAPPKEYYDSGPVKTKNEHRKMWRIEDGGYPPGNTEQMVPADSSKQREAAVTERTQQLPVNFPPHPPPPPNFMYPQPPTGQFFPPPGHYPPPVFPQTASILHPPPYYNQEQQQQPQEDQQKPTNVNLDSALSYFRHNAGHSS
ncbi:coiled-coil domain-containing protein 174-like [Saccoglossus kowalevskii]|uniref:Coiled-coil domain-containing protein 174-like n=1 Tax=Saccoglossus kowalevskii TaxID=10224 RepID=A0ABM0MQS5_SACKO|nr:PREDICTED: coiled-coil domain-containing protein 174-like [Saccoglossus kowalevskii]